MTARFVLLLLVWGCGVDRSQAATANGGFESGVLTPWVLTGAGAAVSNEVFSPAIAAPSGRFMGYITTLNNEGVEDFGFFNESPDIDVNASLSLTLALSPRERDAARSYRRADPPR